MLSSDLPQEILEQIADYLSIRDKISCSLVCRSWKRAFQYTIYSDITIRSHEAFQDIMTSSQHSRHKYHEIGHLVRYLKIKYYYGDITAEKIYALQKTFPNIKYLYFPISLLQSNAFRSTTDCNFWGLLTELHMNIATSGLPAMGNAFVEASVCFPLLRRLTIRGRIHYNSNIAFSVNDFETIHLRLKHLEYMNLSTSLLTLSDTDLKRIPNVSPATTMKILDMSSNKTDHRWLCYFARKYPNLRTIDLSIEYMFPGIEEQRNNTMTLFRQVPVSFQHLENLKIKYFHVIEEREFFLADKINFHDTPLKHISIVISVPYVAYSPDNLCDVPKNIAETCLAKLSKTIKSFQLKYPNPHTTPLHLMGMENNLCNLVKLGISISVFADIDTLFRAAPRLRYLELAYADIKVKDELYNSERFKLRSFGLTNSTITSDVLQFLSFHCRNLDTLSLSKVSVYGSFTTPGCQFIDMTYNRLETLYIDKTSFIIKNVKRCPENLNLTLITRPVDDIPPKQEYDPKVLSTVSGGTSVKTHYDFFYKSEQHQMTRVSKIQDSHTTKFFSYYEENNKTTMEEQQDLKRGKAYKIWEKSHFSGYTQINLGYVTKYNVNAYYL